MDFNRFKQAVIAAAEKLGVKEYELYYSFSESTDVGTFKHEINEFSSSVDGGVCFRCLVDGKMGYASTEALNDAEAESVVARAVENARSLESDDKQFLVAGGQKYQAIEKKSYPLPDTVKLVKTALDVDAALYAADPMIIDGSQGGAGVSVGKIAIYNSNGLDLSYENSGSYFIAAAVVSQNGEMSDSYEFRLGSLDDADIAGAVKKSVDDAKAMLGADVAPTGAYPVVFAPRAMASLLSVYSSAFSSENAQKGLSRLAGKEGQKIASDIVTIVDDPFYKDSAMPRNFDAEGSPTYTKNVIEKGVLKTLLYNLKTANVAGVKTTGNASKGSYSSSVGIKPFTFYIAPGDVTEEQLIEKAGNGVYITSLGGLHAGANAVSGDFSLQSSGFMIENGKKTDKAVKSFTVAGNFYSLLGQITAISDTVEKPRSGGSTAFCSPAVLVEGLTVAGK